MANRCNGLCGDYDCTAQSCLYDARNTTLVAGEPVDLGEPCLHPERRIFTAADYSLIQRKDISPEKSNQ